jgi:hypothetical protein
MNLKRVTITGADDPVPIEALAELADEFPFVEWAILVSKGQEGKPRFPSRDWIGRFAVIAAARSWKVSTHVCGPWVRQILEGSIDWEELPVCVRVSERVQINAHGYPASLTSALAKSLRLIDKDLVFPWDGVNAGLALAAREAGCKASVLFDISAGAGRLPHSWPAPPPEFWCGYAGGLGPDNLVEQLKKIEELCNKPYWIDMERRVRTNDDILDLAAVRIVLNAVAGLLGPDGRDVDPGVRKTRGS